MEALRGELIDVDVNRRELGVMTTLAMVAAGVLRGIGVARRIDPRLARVAPTGARRAPPIRDWKGAESRRKESPEPDAADR